jgi:hypothetical protein
MNNIFILPLWVVVALWFLQRHESKQKTKHAKITSSGKEEWAKLHNLYDTIYRIIERPDEKYIILNWLYYEVLKYVLDSLGKIKILEQFNVFSFEILNKEEVKHE